MAELKFEAGRCRKGFREAERFREAKELAKFRQLIND